MCHDICAPLKRTAVDRRGKGVIYDQRYTVSVRGIGEFFKIQDDKGRIRDRFAEYRLRVILKCSLQFVRAAVRVYECRIHPHLFDRMCVKIICPSVKSRSTHNVVACLYDIHDRIKISRLA